MSGNWRGQRVGGSFAVGRRARGDEPPPDDTGMAKEPAMSKRIILICGAALLLCGRSQAQEAVIAPAENLVVDGIQKIPAALADTAGRYGSYRSANLADWHPVRREMLIATRFGDTPQLH